MPILKGAKQQVGAWSFVEGVQQTMWMASETPQLVDREEPTVEQLDPRAKGSVLWFDEPQSCCSGCRFNRWKRSERDHRLPLD